jgi:DNA helicase-2/ATP-dependent DNA helicase PcrA
MLGHRLALVRDWPGPARPNDADAVFPQGWRRAALEAAGAGGVQASLLETLPEDDRELFERLASANAVIASDVRQRETREIDVGEEPSPTSVSVGGVTTYAQCPKRFYWSSVRPLPRFSGPAARIGTEIHRWIERRARGQGRLLELEDTPDLTDEELAGDPGRLERLRRAFENSRFAERTPLLAERPFLLRVDGFTVAGRIDAVFGEPNGSWEVVDWKTGRRPSGDDPSAGVQLDIYGLACVEIWRKDPSEVQLTYLYLGDGEELSRPMERADAVRERLRGALRSIGGGAFDPTPGPWCRHCDFRSFCDAGTAWLRAADSGAAATTRR